VTEREALLDANSAALLSEVGFSVDLDGGLAHSVRCLPPWSRVEGKSYVDLPQMPPLRGGISKRWHLYGS